MDNCVFGCANDTHNYSLIQLIMTPKSCVGSTGKEDDRERENCRKPHWLWRHHIHTSMLLLFLLFSSPPLVSANKWRDGVMVNEGDYQALKALKHELVDFRGVLSSWNDTGAGACSGGWIGIKCVNGQVIAIQLPYKGLGGTISEKVGHLAALRRLSLHDNLLVGPVPTSLGFLTNLRGVYLFNNRLSGSIPHSIANCPLLQTLDLSNNQLIGAIPPNLLLNSTRIYRLNLSFNAISGRIPPSLTRFPSLTFLAFQHNNLSGSIPDTWGNSSYQLQSLTLDHNLLSGSIPPSLAKLGVLRELNLGHNQIDGTIPSELGSLLRLQQLDLSNNALNGRFPHTFSGLSSLISLNLKNNLLNNQISDALATLRNLSVLNLSNNQFKGPIPLSITNITSLTLLDLSGNNFTGEIPMSLANLPGLSSLDVSYNNLSGVVPSALSKKFNSSSFVGNLLLCGYSSSTTCSSPPPQSLPSPTRGVGTPEHRHRKLSTKDIILIAAGAMLVVLLLVCCILLCCLIRKRSASKAKNGGSNVLAPTARGTKAVPTAGSEVQSGGEAGGKLVHFDGPFVFTADDLLCATAEIMGKSTYGTAYKATLEDGNQVAVKRLREKITKGQKEFEIEVSELGKIRHPNVLALRAYYLGPKGEKLLVYDYMSNGSLASFLHARGPETTIAWPTRMTIIVGITRGLCFLHTKESIVHGNLTSSNVLLDEQKNPKIADVGLSRLMTSAGNTNIIATAGTLGYRAPELSKLKNANSKTDVYSLGMIMLELLTGKSPSEATDGLDLPQWVASIVKEEWTNEVFDVELMRDASNIGDELLNTLKLALHCVDPSPGARPECDQILQKLEEIKPELAATLSTSSADDAAELPVKSTE